MFGFAFGALVRAPRLGMVSVWALALLASIGHAEERADKPVESGVFYVSATVLSDGAGGLSGRGTAVAFASAECEWDDAPPGATVACVSPVAEGARQRIVVRHVNAAGEPVEAETDTEFQYRTIPISATAGSDYLSASGTVTIEEGELLSLPATFTTLDDVIDEFRESFVVELKTDSSIDLEFDHVVIPIEDNDPEVRVSLEGEEGSEDAGALSFEVSLTGASGKLKQRLAQMERQIKALDAETGRLIAEDEGLSRRAEVLTSIPGIARITAAGLLTEMPELGRIDGKAAASLSGLAPVTRESGAWKGRSFIGGGRSRPRRMLYMAAVSAITHNPDLARKYRELRERGKPPKVALVAVMRKLVVLANALLAQDREWTPRPVGASA